MIIAISKDDPWWEKTRAFAKDCPWQPGRRLAKRMSKNDFLDWEKVFVAVHGEDVVGFCVLEENGNIPAKFSCSPFYKSRLRWRRIPGRAAIPKLN